MKKLKKRNIMEISSGDEKEEIEKKISSTNMEKGAVRKELVTEDKDSEKILDVERNMMKLQNEVIEITHTMSAMAQSSKSEIEAHTNHLSNALEQGILSQDQRLKNFETVIQNSLERLTLGIEDRLNNQKMYLDDQIKAYDEKFNAEMRDHTVGASRRNHQKQSNIRTQNSPMSIDDSPNEVRKKDSNFMAALKAFPSEKRFSNSSTSESWILFKQYIITHCDEYSLTPLKA